MLEGDMCVSQHQHLCLTSEPHLVNTSAAEAQPPYPPLFSVQIENMLKEGLGQKNKDKPLQAVDARWADGLVLARAVDEEGVGVGG